MNEFTCSEHSVRIRTSKKRITGKQPLKRCYKTGNDVCTACYGNLRFLVVVPVGYDQLLLKLNNRQ